MTEMENHPFPGLPRLETRRLVLRPLTLDDADDVFAYCSDPEVARYVTWSAHESVADSRSWLSACMERQAAGEPESWGLELKATGRIVGTCGYAKWYPRHARAEIGYALGRAYWNRGLMTEAVRRVLVFGFADGGLYRIEGRCDPANVGSARVMQKSGMQYEGLLRGHLFAKGRFHDVQLYAILRRDWEETAGGRPGGR